MRVTMRTAPPFSIVWIAWSEACIPCRKPFITRLPDIRQCRMHVRIIPCMSRFHHFLNAAITKHKGKNMDAGCQRELRAA
jgi:hypothetical protein